METDPDHSEPDWVSLARSVAINMKHHVISPEHMFLAHMGSSRSLLPGLLLKLGCEVDILKNMVEQILFYSDPGLEQENMPLTRSAEEVLKLGYLSSRKRQANEIHERDLIWGLFEYNHSILGMLLDQRWGISVAKVKAVLFE